MIKSPWEIVQMEKTARISYKTFEYIRETIRPGYTEMEFGGMVEAFARKIGHAGRLRVRDYQTEGYPWHILSGVSGGMVGLLDSPASGQGTSAAFPVGAGNRKLLADEPIMIDLSSVMNGFHMDETRMFAIGTMPREALDASLAIIDIHDWVLDHGERNPADVRKPRAQCVQRREVRSEPVGRTDAGVADSLTAADAQLRRSSRSFERRV